MAIATFSALRLTLPHEKGNILLIAFSRDGDIDEIEQRLHAAEQRLCATGSASETATAHSYAFRVGYAFRIDTWTQALELELVIDKKAPGHVTASLPSVGANTHDYSEVV